MRRAHICLAKNHKSARRIQRRVKFRRSREKFRRKPEEFRRSREKFRRKPSEDMSKLMSETEKGGFVKPPTKPSMKRRADWHDYSGRGLYMVTLAVHGRYPVLGTLVGEPRPHVEPTALGWQIIREEIKKMPLHFPNIKVYKLMVMPDHIHMIIFVSAPFAGNKQLGHAIGAFKSGCSRAYERYLGKPNLQLFEDGYNDRILTTPDVLERWKRYLDDNPRRLWVKRNRLEYFTVVTDRAIGSHPCQMIGNLFLLDYPDKAAVIVHTYDTDDVFQQKKKRWLDMAERGCILISAAIAEREKEVMHAAMDAGYPVIWLRNNGFGPFYKPSGRTFDACADGRLLQVSPFTYHTDHRKITRADCKFLNSLAEMLVKIDATKFG